MPFTHELRYAWLYSSSKKEKPMPIAEIQVVGNIIFQLASLWLQAQDAIPDFNERVKKAQDERKAAGEELTAEALMAAFDEGEQIHLAAIAEVFKAQEAKRAAEKLAPAAGS